jgi:excinuclease UvrABC nuclease subunit
MTMPDHDSDESRLLATLALTLVSGVGPRLQAALLQHFESPEAIFRQSVAKSLEELPPRIFLPLRKCSTAVVN